MYGNKKGRYYYIGSLPGRIQEMKGIQNVTMNGKHVGWFLFDSNGENVQSQWSGDRYFLGDGRMASGPVTVGDYKYFLNAVHQRSVVEKNIRANGSSIIISFIMQQKRADYMEPDGKQSRYRYILKSDSSYQCCKERSDKLYGYLDSHGKFTTSDCIIPKIMQDM